MGQVLPTKPWGSLALLSLALLMAVPGPASGLPPVRKTPGGAFVTEFGGSYSVPRGQEIEWSIELCNDTAGPLVAQLFDQVHGGDCGPDHQYLTLACPPEIDPPSAGGTVETCDDSIADSLDVTGLSVGAAGCIELRFRTRVDLLTPPGVTEVCNIGFYSTDSEGSGQTTPPGAAFPGCTCVQLEPAIPTDLDLRLDAIPDEFPFVGGEASTALWQLSADNLTPREAVGLLRVPMPDGLTITEIIDCPPGANCSVGPVGEYLVQDLSVAEGGSFTGAFRVTGDCRTFGQPEMCAQAIFSPDEDPASPVLSDSDPATPGAQATCMPVGSEDLSLSVKTWELIDDADGDGVASRDDRVRFHLRVWNRGLGPARDVVVTDTIPLGFDRTSIVVDPSGSYVNPTASWTLPTIGPGGVVELWLEATLTGNNPCNKARIASRTRMDCLGTDVSTDDPNTVTPADSTCPDGPGDAAPIARKSFTFDDADGDGAVSDGETVSVTIEVTNEGLLTATGVVLEDLLAACWGDIVLPTIDVQPPGAGNDLSTARELRIEELGGPDGLSPNERVVVSFDLPALAAAGCCNQAMVTWAEGASSLASDDPRTLGGLPDATCLDLAAAPRPRLLKQVDHVDRDGDGVPSTGDRLRYTVSVRNEGTAALSGLALTDELPFEVLLDEASVIVAPPGALDWRAVPAGDGAFSSGRIEVPSFDLAPGRQASLIFEVVLLGGDEVCNRASLAAPDQFVPVVSEDIGTGGATCVTVVYVATPTLGVSVGSSGPLTIGCAQPGEEITYEVDWDVTGDADATSTMLTLNHSSKLTVVDPDGALEGPGQLTWDLGPQGVGSVGTRLPVLAAACDEDAGELFEVDAVFSSPEAILDAIDVGPDVTTGRTDLSGTVDLFHDDADANGRLSPGELVTVTITIDEIGGCETGDVRVVLDLPPEIVAAAVRDGGVDGGSQIVWESPASAALGFLAPGGRVVLGADLELGSGDVDCLMPRVSTTIEWPVSQGSACASPESWTEPDRALPDTDCIVVDPVDLLREDAVSSLGPGGPMPALANLLEEAGNWNGCDGEGPRVDPAQLLLPGAGPQLDMGGVVAAGDAIPVGEGAAGVLVFYEATATCAVLKACKVDDDGDPLNGRESVLLTTGADCEP